MRDVNLIYFLFIASVASFETGCKEHIADAVWIEETAINVASKDMPACLERAGRNVPILKINHSSSIPSTHEMVFEVVPKSTENRYVAYVKYEQAGVAKIEIIGKGTRIPEEERPHVAALLRTLSDNITRECAPAGY